MIEQPDEYLLNLGEPASGTDLETRQKRRDVAVNALSTKWNASEIFERAESTPGLLLPISDYMRKKGGDAETLSALEDPNLGVQETIDRLALGISNAGREIKQTDSNNKLDAGIVSNATGLIVPPSKIMAEREGNLSMLVSELSSASEAAKAATHTEIKDVSQRRKGRGSGSTGEGLTGEATIAGGIDLIAGAGHNEVINMIQKVLPEASQDGNRITDFDGAVTAWKEYTLSLGEEESADFVRRSLADLAGRSGVANIGRDFAYYHNIQTLMANVDGATSGVSNTLNGVIAVAELAGLGTLAAGLVKKGVKVGAGTTAKYLGRGKAGSEALVRASGSKAGDKVLDAVDTSPEAVMGTHVLPKTGDQVVDYADRFVDLDFLDPVKVAELQRVEQDTIESLLTSIVPKHKLNGTIIDDTPGGFKVNTLLGGADGNGFQAKSSAAKLVRDINENAGASADLAEVVESNGRFFARYTSEVDYTKAELPNFVNGESINGRFRGLFGRGSQFNGILNKMATSAELDSVVARDQAMAILKPYTTLKRGKQERVQATIIDGSREVKWYDDAELVARGHTDPAERAAYFAYKDLAARDLRVQGARVRAQLIDQNYQGIKLGDDIVPAKRLDGPQGAKQVKDINGKIIATPDSNTHRFYKMPGGETNGRSEIVDIIAVPRGTKVHPIPEQPLKSIDGYLPRRYDNPAFIQVKRTVKRNGIDDVVTETIATAGSLKRASEALETMKLEGKVGKDVIEIKARYADQLDGSVNLDLIEQLAKDGRLHGQTRKPNPLKDVDHEYVMPSVDELMGNMVHAIGTHAGSGRFTDTMLDQLKRGYGDEWGNLAMKPPIPTDAAGRTAWYEAASFHSYLQNVNGVGKAQSAKALSLFRQDMAEFFYNDSLRASTSVGKSISKGLGDELSGLGSPVTDILKRRTFEAYLLTNPFRQAILQATMAPTYFGVHGGTRYLFNPKGFLADMGDLALSKAGVKKLAPELAEVSRRYESSGLKSSIEQHIFDIGSMASSGIKARGAYAQVLGTAKKYGMDLGVGIDKRAAFLLSYNRFKTVNKGLPKSERDWKDIASFAEGMALNQNKSDTLMTQNGVLSLFTQFLSHQFKMTGRIAGLEKDFDVSERVKMAAATVMSYGVAGYGLKEVYDEAKAALGVDVPPAVDLVIEQGVLGASFNMVMNAAGIEEELGFSDDFSPVNFVGNYKSAVENMINGIVSANGVNLNANFAAASLVGNVGSAIGWTASMVSAYGDNVISAETALKSSAVEYFRLFPITNNLYKAYHIAQYGEITDSKGRTIANTNSGFLAMLDVAGIKTREEKDYRVNINRLYGEYNDASSTGILGAIADQAKGEAKRHAKLIGQSLDGDLTSAEAGRIMKLHQAVIQGMDARAAGAYRNAYLTTLKREVSKYGQGYTLSKALVEMYERSAARGEFTSLDEQIEWLRTQQFEGAGQLADELSNRYYGSK